MFGRKSDTPAPAKSGSDVATAEAAGSGKGRPTPTRKEAEAARLAKARTPRTRKAAATAQRQRRLEANTKMREAMKTGDDRHMPTRDKGPVRRFVRDYVDTKFTIAELILPLLVLTLIASWIGGGNPDVTAYANAFMMLMLLASAANLLMIWFGLRRELTKRWPEMTRKGLAYYACIRTLQLRFLRMPKTQVRIGEALPETYR